tara:strand:- start:433 stop:1263 length:831 start_codon:yes stop_codon:yes gene_type:complete
MATINLGSIKFNWKGAYNGATAYAVDDVVSSGGSSYVCILASTGNATSNGTYWEQMSSAGTNGTDGTDVGTTLTAQGDILYRNGSGLAKLGAGTSGQYLETKGASANPVWSTVSTGAYTLSQFTVDTFGSQTHAGVASTAYNFGTTLTTTPSASTDLIELSLSMNVEGQTGGYYGVAFGVNTSDSWGTSTGDSRLKVSSGEHAMGMGAGSDSERYQRLHLIGTYTTSQLGMSAGTQYYIKPHVLTHNPAGQIITSFAPTNSTGAGRGNFTLKRWTA